MKKVLILLFILLLAALEIFAQCGEPAAAETGPVVAARQFEVSGPAAENTLTIEAGAANSSWAVKDAESAVLTVFVDEQYNQDVMLFGGAEKFTYRVILGQFAAGKHNLKIVLNGARSAKNARRVKISAVTVGEGVNGAPALERLALANAPFLYARPDTIDKFSDIPLLTYYEIVETGKGPAKIRYTTIFTNEDGGTRTAALMARWGRATDIEWVYELDITGGAAGEGIIQSANHVTKTFAGDYVFGRHPLIYDATVNNNFADRGCSPLRTALLPVRADLSKKSRETIMDENPWTYRIMTEEALREGRIVSDKTSIDTIADPRDYLYAEIYGEPQNAALTFEAADPGAGRTISSDDGNVAMRVDRPGFVRIALRLPAGMRGRFPASVSVSCHAVAKRPDNGDAPAGECRQVNLIKIIRLDEKFHLHEVKISPKLQNLKAGEHAEFVINPLPSGIRIAGLKIN